MKRNSINFKLFIITTMLLFVFLASTLTFQTAFFEKFYVNRKISHLKTDLSKFTAYYAKSKDNLMAVNAEMYHFTDTNNSEVMISRKEGNKYIIVSSLKFNGPSATATVQGGAMLQVAPLIDDPMKNEVMLQAFDYWETQLKNDPAWQKGKIYTTTYKHPISQSNYIILISPVAASASDDVIIAVSSMQPIGEAANVIKEFYVYIFAAAGVLILLFSLIYTNMISKPLVALNKTAEQLLNMDFSARCNVNSDDEIGSLGKTLNFLSSRLNDTLSELKKANTKLKKDIDKERQLEKLRREFVADVSHELKTPISLIKGYAEGLKDDIVDESNREFYIDVIIDEADKMGGLVGDMLNLSQLEAGKFRLELENFNLYQLTAQIVKKYHNSLTIKSIDLKTMISDKHTEITADKRKLEQVLTNFISNAIRHTPEQGKILISIEEDNDKTLWSIENSGENIDENEITKIWDKFYRVEKSRNKQHGGTGLGLAIVKNVLDVHSFGYGVRNTETGVLFYFEIPKAADI